MKLTKTQLKKIIKEELESISEIDGVEQVGEIDIESLRNQIKEKLELLNFGSLFDDIDKISDIEALQTILRLADARVGSMV
jgi:hypothetical protein